MTEPKMRNREVEINLNEMSDTVGEFKKELCKELDKLPQDALIDLEGLGCDGCSWTDKPLICLCETPETEGERITREKLEVLRLRKTELDEREQLANLKAKYEKPTAEEDKRIRRQKEYKSRLKKLNAELEKAVTGGNGRQVVILKNRIDRLIDAG